MDRREELRSGPRFGPLPNLVRPVGLAGTPAEPAVVAISVAVMALVFVLEVETPKDVTFSPYALLAVLVCAWVAGGRALIIVTAASMLFQAIRPVFDNASWLTVFVNFVALLLAASLGHAAAVNSAEARRSRERQLALLLEAARDVNTAASVAEVAERIARAAAAFVSRGASRAIVWQIEEGSLRILHERDELGTFLPVRAGFELTPAVRAVLSDRQARELELHQLDDELARQLREVGVQSVAMAPVMIGGQPYGLLSAGRRERGPFTMAQLAPLAGLADLAGISIARARQLETERSRARVLELLREVLLATASAAAPEDVAQRVVEEARTMLGAATVALALRDRERPGLWVKAASRPVELAAVDPESILGRVFATAAPMEAAAATWSPGDQELAGEASALLVAPVLAGQDCLGAIAAAVDAPGEDAMHLLALLGSQLGSAVIASELRGELVESERIFRSLCAGLGCAAILHDATGKTVDANWAAESLTGVPVRQLAAGGVFGPDWSVKTEAGSEVPLSMRPPRYVIGFDRPLLGLVAEVTAPGRRPAWLRIDSNPILEHGRLKWIVTTFYPVPPPAARPARARRARPVTD